MNPLATARSDRDFIAALESPDRLFINGMNRAVSAAREAFDVGPWSGLVAQIDPELRVMLSYYAKRKPLTEAVRQSPRRTQ